MNEIPLTVALVLKTGGDYTFEHVNNLTKAIKKHLTLEHRVVCLTDDSTGFDMDYIDKVIPFRHNFPKWWGKIEMFRPKLFKNEQVLYFDLDTFIIDNIDDIGAYRGEFTALNDFYTLSNVGSGLMSWNANSMYHVYDRFIPNSTQIMRNYREGDQKWIDENKPSIRYIQNLFNKKVISFKVHCRKFDGTVEVPDDASVICFHGPPRPHQVTDPEIIKHWNP